MRASDRTREETVTFAGSPWRMALLSLGSLGMAALGLAIALPILPNVPSGSFAQFVGYAAAAFFALCFVVILWRAVTLRGAVVTLSPETFHDVRVSARPVAWAAVESLGVWEHSGQRVVVLRIPDEAWNAAEPTWIASWTRNANRALGADGYCITHQGLSASFDELATAIRRFLP